MTKKAVPTIPPLECTVCGTQMKHLADLPLTAAFASAAKPGTSSGYLVDFSTRPLWLLKGKDRTGKNDFSIGH